MDSFPNGTSGKESDCQCRKPRDSVSVPGLGRSGEDGQGCKAMTKDLGLRWWLPWGWECSSLLTPSYLGFALLSNLVFPLFLCYWIRVNIHLVLQLSYTQGWANLFGYTEWTIIWTGLDYILHWLETLLTVLLTSSGCIRFLLLIIYKARLGKRKFLYILLRLAELVHFYLRIFMELAD